MNSVCNGHYNVIYTESLHEDIREVYLNIVSCSKSEETARAFINRVREGIDTLSFFPNAHPKVKTDSYEGLSDVNIHKLIIDKYIVYYYVDDMNAAVTGLFYGGRSTDAIIRRVHEYFT